MVTLAQMLDAREARAIRQRELLAEFGGTVVSFTMNVPGPVKTSPALRRAFGEGLYRLEDGLRAMGVRVLRREVSHPETGSLALAAVAGEAVDVKRLCVDIEDRDPLGRLFDLDVITPSGGIGREELGLPPRTCMVCGKAGRGCASRRVHPVDVLQARTGEILREFFRERDSGALAAQAARALLYEVCTTPKPGLVDRANCGSHGDMDMFTFVDSAAALLPYFRQAAAVGMDTADLPRREAFQRLRAEGIRGERDMFRATGGVNTHKGAVFSLGLFCGAMGRLWSPAGFCRDLDRVLAECGALAAEAACVDDGEMTAGQRIRRDHGLRGILGEAAGGFPAAKAALEALEAALDAGAAVEEAGVAALLGLMARVEDTNLMARGGLEGWRWAAEQAKALLAEGGIPRREAVEALDRAFMERNLSPGGCADLLAMVYLLWFCGGEGDRE